MAALESDSSSEGDATALAVAVGGPAGSGGSGGTTTNASSKVKVVKKIPPAPPWDPLSSPDWDKESHTKEALLRIKRYIACKIGEEGSWGYGW